MNLIDPFPPVLNVQLDTGPGGPTVQEFTRLPIIGDNASHYGQIDCASSYVLDDTYAMWKIYLHTEPGGPAVGPLEAHLHAYVREDDELWYSGLFEYQLYYQMYTFFEISVSGVPLCPLCVHMVLPGSFMTTGHWPLAEVPRLT